MNDPTVLRHSKTHRQAAARARKNWLTRTTLAFHDPGAARLALRSLVSGGATGVLTSHDQLNDQYIIAADLPEGLKIDRSGAIFRILSEERVRMP